jgi:hypothetical protein
VANLSLTPAKLPTTLYWLWILQHHRAECIRRMAFITGAPVGSANLLKSFFKKTTLAQPPMPHLGVNVRHVALSPTIWESLLGRCFKSDPDGLNELRQTCKSVTKHVKWAKALMVLLPDLHRFCSDDLRRRGHPEWKLCSLRTDGVPWACFLSTAFSMIQLMTPLLNESEPSQRSQKNFRMNPMIQLRRRGVFSQGKGNKAPIKVLFAFQQRFGASLALTLEEGTT